MRRLRPLVVFVLVSACGSFDAATSAPNDAGTPDGGTPDAGGSDAGGNDADAPKTGCAALSSTFRLCSDFDANTSVQQTTKPDQRLWLPSEQKTGTLSIKTVSPFSPPNVLTSAGDGNTESFTAQVSVPDLAVTKDVLRLSMALRVGTRPSGGDAYFATIDFPNVRFTAFMHADGTIDLAQSVPPHEVQSKTQKPTVALTPGIWSRVEIYVNRGAVGGNGAAVGLNGTTGALTVLQDIPTGNATVAIGIGYCDVPCGKPSLDFDDVVLVEE